MKQLEYIYTSTENLQNFIHDNNFGKETLIQLFAQNEIIAQDILNALNGFEYSYKINTIISLDFENTQLSFTKLPMNTKPYDKDIPAEFEYFHSGPVVIFKRIPQDDCWIVSHVTQSVEQWGFSPSYFLENADAVKKAFYIDDTTRVRKNLHEAIDSGKDKLNQQYRINKKDGKVAWVSEYTQIIRNSEGKAIELIGYLVDITQDKEKELLYSKIINTTTEGFWLLDAELNIIDVNYSLSNMLGYSKDEMLGNKPLSFIYSDDHSLCQTQTQNVSDTSNRIYEITFRKKDGSLLHALVNATTMYDETGEMKVFAFMTDITKHKKTEENLIIRQEEIEVLNNSLESKINEEVEKNREKDQMMYQQSRLASMGEMIGNIAHQWRQPLNIMALVMQDLYISDQLDNLTSKKVEESYEKANNLLQYMSQTIDDFRNFFQQGGEESEFSVKDSLDTVYNLINTNLAYNHIECKIEVQHDSIIKGGLNEFKQVLINIINNAQEAIQGNDSSHKKINIFITQKNEQAVICLSDDGGGISKNVIDKVFDPYFTTKNKTQGTGLGLYMSKQIIENSMCGSLSVENIKNGAKFTISLPIKKK